MKRIILLAILCVFALPHYAQSNSATAMLKIWETNEKVNKMVGTVRLQMERDQRPGARINQFWVKTISNFPYAIGYFQGTCSESLAVELTATLSGDDAKAYKESRSSNHLPIAEVVNLMKDVLIKQCEQLHVIRVRYRPQQYPQGDYDYHGTLTQAENWRIQDGYVKTAFDEKHLFIIDYHDRNSIGGVYHEASCGDKEPILFMEPRKKLHAFSKRMKIFHFVELAKTVSIQYAQQCPQIDRIKFILYPLPSDHRCAEGDECFLISEKHTEANSWEIDQSQLALISSRGPIADAIDMMEVLAAGEFRIVHDYLGYFEFFYDAFINAYSTYCRANITDPVGREYRTIHQRFDNYGNLLSSEQMGPAITIFMERKYASRFDQYHNSWPNWATKQFMIKFANITNPTPNKAVGMELATSFLTKTTRQLANAISGNCMDDRIQTIYLNMYNLAHNALPIKGKYTTDKKPVVLTAGINSSSAPKMIEAIIEKRKQRLVESKKYNTQLLLLSDQNKAQTNSTKLDLPNQPQVEPETKVKPIEKLGPQIDTPLEKANTAPHRGGSPEQVKNRRELNKKLQALRMQHNAEMKAAAQAYRKKLRNTKDKEERRVIKEEHRAYREAMTVELQHKIAELKSEQDL